MVTPISARQVTKTAKIEMDGSFSLDIEYPFPYQQIWFSVGELFYTGLIVNKDLFVELDMNKIKAAKKVNFNGTGVRYLGTDGPLNVYLNNYILYKRPEQLELDKQLSSLTHSRKPVVSDIFPEYNRMFNELKNIQDSYVAENPSPYSWILENERQSDYYAQLCSMYWNKVMDDSLWQKIKQHKSYLVSNNGTSFYSYMTTYIKSLPAKPLSVSWKDVALLPDLDPTEKAYIDSFKADENNRLKGEYSESGNKERTENMVKWSRQLMPRMSEMVMRKRIDKAIHNLDSIFTPEKADFLKLQLNDSKDPVVQNKIFAQLLGSMHTTWTKNVVNTEYAKTLRKINEINGTLAKSTPVSSAIPIGKPVMTTSFDAKMYEVSNMSVKDFLSKLKDRFRDTAIVLDLWATWCAPCISEMPHSKKLLQQSKDLPVVFVYLCTTSGSDKNQWKSKVAELKLPGLHFFIDEKLDAEIRNLFSFSGYPGYAFIDRAGNYKPGAFQRISEVNKEKLAGLLKRD